MTSEQINDVLRVLSLVIVADGRVLKEEVDALANEAHKLIAQIDEGVFFTKSMAVDWFHNNRTTISLTLSSNNSLKLTSIALRKIDFFENKRALYFSMQRIAHSDNEYHSKENEVIQLAAKYWGVVMPNRAQA